MDTPLFLSPLRCLSRAVLPMVLRLSHRRHLLCLLAFPSPPNTLQFLRSSPPLCPASSHQSRRARPSPPTPQSHHLLQTMPPPAYPPRPQAPSPHQPRRSMPRLQLQLRPAPCLVSNGPLVAQIAATNLSHRQHPLPRFLKALARQFKTRVARPPLPAQRKASLNRPMYLPHPSHTLHPEYLLQCPLHPKHLLRPRCPPQRPPTLKRHLQPIQLFPSSPTPCRLFAQWSRRSIIPSPLPLPHLRHQRLLLLPLLPPQRDAWQDTLGSIGRGSQGTTPGTEWYMTNDGIVRQVTLVAGLLGLVDGNGAHIPLGFFVHIF